MKEKMLEKEKKETNVIKEIIPYIVIIIVVVIVRTYFVTPVMVDGDSMNPTLKNNNILLLNKRSTIDRYDIVVIKTVANETLIKRVMALPGETIYCVNQKIFINGEEIPDKTDLATNDFEEVTLKDDEYFVMGDNRGDSKDSRIIGPVKKEEIKGQVVFRFWPFNKIGTLN